MGKEAITSLQSFDGLLTTCTGTIQEQPSCDFFARATKSDKCMYFDKSISRCDFPKLKEAD